jgi:hypothetical protein
MDSSQQPQLIPPPQQFPAPSQPSGQFNPQQYDFITNPKQPKKRRFSLLPSTTSRILVTFLISAVILTVVIIGYLLLTGGGRQNNSQMIGVIQKQTELARVAEIGNRKAGSQQAKNLAQSTAVVMTTQKQTFNALLKKNKIKVSTKEAAGGQDKKTDQQLSVAESNGRFDDAFMQVIRDGLSDYQKTLQAAFNGSGGKLTREVLDSDYQQAGMLLEMATPPSTPVKTQ